MHGFIVMLLYLVLTCILIFILHTNIKNMLNKFFKMQVSTKYKSITIRLCIYGDYGMFDILFSLLVIY
jgi:hypothetical protein